MRITGQDHWAMIPLDQLLVQSEETTEIQPDRRYRQVTVRLWGQGVVLRNEVSGARIFARKRRVVSANQFILSRIDARNGAFGLVPESLDGAVVSNDFPAFNVNRQRLEPRFLAWMSKTEDFVNLCRAASEGTTNRVRLKVDRFLEMPISLPPLDEQRRIVARIGELAALIEEAQELRVKAREGAEALLVASAKRAFDHHPWDEITIGRLVGRKNLRNGRSVKETPLRTDIRCLRLSAMRSGRIDCADAKPILLTKEEAEPFLVHPGDVFVMRGSGSKQLVGQAGLIGESAEGTVFPDLLIRVPLDCAKVLPSFFVAWWNSPQMRETIEDTAKTTSGIWKINQGHIASFPIPFAPLSEQHRIVADLDGLQAQVDELRTLHKVTQAELDALLPSVLDRAFKGEL